MTAATKCLAPILLLLLLFPDSARAQGQPGAVEGTVLSDYGNGIGGAIVTLEPLRLVEYTDQNGAFAFRGVLSFWTSGELADEALASEARQVASALLLGFTDRPLSGGGDS